MAIFNDFDEECLNELRMRILFEAVLNRDLNFANFCSKMIEVLKSLSEKLWIARNFTQAVVDNVDTDNLLLVADKFDPQDLHGVKDGRLSRTFYEASNLANDVIKELKEEIKRT